MQNKGLINAFAVLVALACLFYLSFTWITRGVEDKAVKYAESYLSRPAVQKMIADASNGNASMMTYLKDSIKAKAADNYLDSMKKVKVYNVGLTNFTYEECKEKELNLGLDLRGGINVTLEVSVGDIIKNLTNNNPDPAFNNAVENAKKLQNVSTKDFVTLFGEEYQKLAPNAKLASLFQTIELKGKVDFNASNEQVLAFVREQVDQSIETAKSTLGSRIDRFGVAQPNIQKLAGSGRILVELPGVKDKARVRKLLQGSANLEFWETYDNREIGSAIDQANKRLAAFRGATNKSDSTQTDSSIVAPVDTVKKSTDTTQLAGKTDTVKPAPAKKDSLGDVAKFRKENPIYEFLQPSIYQEDKNQAPKYAPGPAVGYANIKDTAKVNKMLAEDIVKKSLPAKLKLMWANKPEEGSNALALYAIRVTDKNGKAALYGDIISDAKKDFNQQSGGSPIISMQMGPEAANKWKLLTRAASPKNANERGQSIAIVLDNMVYSAPAVNGEIPNGSSQISGNFTNKEADDLVTILSAGKLPAPARIVEETIVGPTLGQEAISAGLLSFIIALIVILVFMVVYYNKAGWVANLVLFINVFFIMGVLVSIGAVLTLPGIAGIVLTIGLSVDANILIFERVREELALGKGMAIAIKEGFKHAMSSIIDSNVTLLILGIILYVFGTGPIQGFATTLIVGILSSLFAAVLLSRVVFDFMLSRGQTITFDNAMTKNAFKNIAFDFVKRRKLYYTISAVIIAAGIGMYFKNGGFNLGVDFKGGRTYQVRFEKDMNIETVRTNLAAVFGSAPETKTFGPNNQLKITTTYRIAENGDTVDKEVEEILEKGLNTLGAKYEVVGQQKVGPTIATTILGKAYLSVLISCLVMFIYIVVRFRKWQYGLGAVVALFHDVAVVLSFYTIFDGLLPFSLEIDQHFIAAILTVMGYTMTETVVVFDRIREKLAESGKTDATGEERNSLINYALNSTLSRTILTSLTIFFVLLVIFIFGGEVIRGFIFALLIGRVIGTYSSLCISTPIVVDFDRKK
jgi:SecD/SecF fusion protein